MESLTASSPSSTWTLLLQRSSGRAGMCTECSRAVDGSFSFCCVCIDNSVFCLSCRCKFLVTEGMQSCTNQLCPGRDQGFSATAGFDFLVDLTDHTGTLHACSLRSPVADKTLGCTVSSPFTENTALIHQSENGQKIKSASFAFHPLQTEEFTSLTDDERTAMKWKFLLERCKIHVKVTFNSAACVCVSYKSMSYTTNKSLNVVDLPFH